MLVRCVYNCELIYLEDSSVLGYKVVRNSVSIGYNLKVKIVGLVYRQIGQKIRE